MKTLVLVPHAETKLLRLVSLALHVDRALFLIANIVTMRINMIVKLDNVQQQLSIDLQLACLLQSNCMMLRVLLNIQCQKRLEPRYVITLITINVIVNQS